ARPATTGLWCRRIVMVSVTKASAPKNANVTSDRLKIVAGSPYLAVNVPAGMSRRSNGSRRSGGGAPRAGRQREPAEHETRRRCYADTVDQSVPRTGRLLRPAELDQRRNGERTRQGDERQKAQDRKST